MLDEPSTRKAMSAFAEHSKREKIHSFSQGERKRHHASFKNEITLQGTISHFQD